METSKSQGRRAAEMLPDGEEKYRVLVESTTDMIYMIDKNNKVLSLNKAAAKLFGKEPKEIIGKSIFDLFPEEIAANYSRTLKKVFKTEKSDCYESRMVIGEKELWNSVSLSPVWNQKGNVVAVIGISRDITKQKHAEEALRFSDAAFRSIQESVIASDLNYTITHWNLVSERIYGIKASEAIGKKLFDVIEIVETYPGENARRFKKLESQGCYQGEQLHRTKHAEVWVRVSVQEVKDGGKRCGWVALATDITPHKRAENKLRDSERKYRSLFDNMLDGFAYCRIVVDDKSNPVDFVYIEVNDAFEKLTGLKKEVVTGKKITEVIPGIRKVHPELFKIYGRVALTGKSTHFDIYFRPLKIWLSISVYCPQRGYFVAVFENITERKQAVERLKTSLKEKEVLLREIHHRVKNNLQVISSLLSLQSYHIKGKKNRELFEDSQNRIKSIALIHEKLYQSKDLARIDFKEYTESLVISLMRSYRASLGKVVLKIEAEEVLLGVDRAIPCGLIISELVSNSLKHAFPDGKKGEVNIALHSSHQKQLELVVSDNGVGIPENLDFRKTKSLGLQLVTILAEDQLCGQIKLDRSRGTKFQIKFKALK